MNTNTTKQETIAEFLARGGKIQRIPSGKSPPPSLTARRKPGHAIYLHAYGQTGGGYQVATSGCGRN